LRACDYLIFIGWIFPGDDPAEVAKPLAPPPSMGQIPTEEVKKDDNGPKDPLASMMAPPVSRGLSSKKRMMGGGPPGMSSPPGMMRGGLGPPGMMASPAVFTPKAAVFTPKTAVFTPKPAAATEDEVNTTETTE
jgi:hypothetical protein